MKSRALVLLFALLLSAGLFAACDSGSGSSDDAGPVEPAAPPDITGQAPEPGEHAYLRSGPIGDGRFVLPNGRAISPAGETIAVSRFPIDVALSPDGATVAVPSIQRASLALIDTETLSVAQTVPLPYTFTGALFSAAGDKLWVSGGGAQVVYEFDRVGGEAVLFREIEVLGYPAGLALSPNEGILYVCCNLGHSLCALDLLSGIETARVGTRMYPYDVQVLPDGTKAYVSNWGAGSVSVVDLARHGGPRETGLIPVGKNPEGMALSPDGARLYVTNSDTDDLSVIDTAADAVVATYVLHDEAIDVMGASPGAVAVSSDGVRLYVACSGYNCVDILDAADGSLLGRIPTGWYPSDLALDEPGGMLYVANGKGLGSGAAGGAWDGSVSAIPLPTPEELAAYTAEVEANNNWSAGFYSVPKQAGSPIPTEWGEPSEQIRHVIFVLKENKTYDQVLGDLAGTEADPAHLVFGEAVTPNIHALAREFVICDNFYVEGDSSIIGHFWSTCAIANDFAEKTWIAGARMPLSTFEEAAKSPAGTIFHNCLDHGVEFRDYGQFIGVADDLVRFAPYIDLKYGFWNMRTSDEDKVDEFIREVEAGLFPPFVYMILPNDHTYGSSSGAPTPRWLVADNDAGLGKLVDYLSHSPYWADTAIFVTQDDPQSGSDHIDPHRTVGMVISPWAKRDHTSSVLYTMSSMWMTIELILGLPPMTKYDAHTAPMYDCFASTPDLTPYEQIPNPIPYEENPKGLPFQDYCDRADWAMPDQVSRLGEVLWSVMRPGEPFPYLYSVDDPAEEAEESREAKEAYGKVMRWVEENGPQVGVKAPER